MESMLIYLHIIGYFIRNNLGNFISILKLNILIEIYFNIIRVLSGMPG